MSMPELHLACGRRPAMLPRGRTAWSPSFHPDPERAVVENAEYVERERGSIWIGGEALKKRRRDMELRKALSLLRADQEDGDWYAAPGLTHEFESPQTTNTAYPVTPADFTPAAGPNTVASRSARETVRLNSRLADAASGHEHLSAGPSKTGDDDLSTLDRDVSYMNLGTPLRTASPVGPKLADSPHTVTYGAFSDERHHLSSGDPSGGDPSGGDPSGGNSSFSDSSSDSIQSRLCQYTPVSPMTTRCAHKHARFASGDGLAQVCFFAAEDKDDESLRDYFQGWSEEDMRDILGEWGKPEEGLGANPGTYSLSARGDMVI